MSATISAGSTPKVTRLIARASSSERDVEDLGVEPDPDLGLEDADRHLTDAAPGGVDDRRPGIRRAPEAALVDARVHLAVERRDGLLDALSDERRVGVGVAHARAVDDDDVGGARRSPHLRPQGR